MMRNPVHDHTEQKGTGIGKEISFPLDEIDKLITRYNSTYIGGWFDPASQTLNLGKQISLENQHKTGENSTPSVIVEVRHEKGNMIFRFEYDKRYMTEEHAEDFVSLIKFAGDELLVERYPQFAKRGETL